MNKLEVFKFEEDKEIRTQVDANGNPLFCVKDVCNGLFLGNVAEATKNLKESELTSIKMMSGGQQRVLRFTTESGLYKLIMQSRKQEAQKFKDWVCETVLPSIRKTGSYTMPTESEKPAYILPTNFKEALLMLVAAEEEKEALNAEVKQLSTKLEEVKPKEEFYDAVMIAENSIDMKTVANVLNCGLGRTQLFEFLRDCGVLNRKNEPQQRFINQGIFEVSISAKYIGGVPRVWRTTYVTPKGLEYISKLVRKYA